VAIFGFLALEAREIDKNWFVSTAFDDDCSFSLKCIKIGEEISF